jgi:hypothetical protein
MCRRALGTPKSPPGSPQATVEREGKTKSPRQLLFLNAKPEKKKMR